MAITSFPPMFATLAGPIASRVQRREIKSVLIATKATCSTLFRSQLHWELAFQDPLAKMVSLNSQRD
eukprot:CAMPEP_0115027714 /NCGR_PEP_ID=MMETSP0216-20121206/35743_1 /TAXON_ID=223996 /ORGANISM="Protocruzia adherens, Strain Boccale" /LENGTH=66 /DNA_ID=CAMNT_0002403507 /DNA_START=20 /DNA_END=217 /DNA_ORIENTATION=-